MTILRLWHQVMKVISACTGVCINEIGVTTFVNGADCREVRCTPPHLAVIMPIEYVLSLSVD